MKKTEMTFVATIEAVNDQPVGPRATLASFRDGGGKNPGFQFTRYYWEGEGTRDGILSSFEAKIHFRSATALRHEVLLPCGASSEYLDRQLLVSRYDETLPSYFYDAFAQIKIELDEDKPLHIGYEMVRAYARRYFVLGMDLPVILVLHAPAIAGSRNKPHVHIMIPARQLGHNGWGIAARELCCDAGHVAALEAWKTFELEWLEKGGL